MSTQPAPDTLGVSRNILRILIPLNAAWCVFILGMLIATVVAPDFMMRGLGFDPATDTSHPFWFGVRFIMVIGIVAAPITHTILARLLAIVDTVRDGDPFVIDNAVRLQKIAWAVLGLELLHILVVIVATNLSTPDNPIDIGSKFSITRWLAVFLLFVLARVFEQGARMREDLAGTV